MSCLSDPVFFKNAATMATDEEVIKPTDGEHRRCRRQGTKAAEVLNVFSFVERGSLRVSYTELVLTPGNQRHYFHVTAYNAAGDGPPSVLVCGTAIGNPDC